MVFGPPAVRGLGNAGGFKLMVQAAGDTDLDTLQAQADKLAARAVSSRAWSACSTASDPAQLYVDIDRAKAKTMGVELTDVFARCRSIWAATTSTTSTASAAPGRLTSRRTPLFAWTRTSSDSSRSATPTATWCLWAQWPRCATRRAGPGDPVQHVPCGHAQRCRATRRRHRGRPRDDGKTGEPGAAAFHDLRVDRAELPAETRKARSSRSGPATESFSAPSWLGVVLVFLVLAGLYESWSWCRSRSFSSCRCAC